MSATKPNPKEEFKQLLTRKQMLQEVLGVADRIEQLHSGLSSAMQMGKQTSNINKELLQDNHEIDAFRMLPPHRLKEVLAKLEGRMIDSIQRVVAYAEQELQTGDEAQFEQTALDLINDFRRSSKTALAMRLLLGEQGHITQPIRLPVAPLELRERVSNMATKEQEVRVKVEGEIIAIRDDSEKLLQTPGLPEPIKAMLNQTVAQMQDNLQHVRSGKGFDALPHPMEILEGSEAQEVEELVESIPLMEVEEVAIEELEVHAVEEEKTGFGTQLNNWLNTPVGVNWEEAAKIKPKEDR